MFASVALLLGNIDKNEDFQKNIESLSKRDPLKTSHVLAPMRLS
jgi:hypothetical protein